MMAKLYGTFRYPLARARRLRTWALAIAGWVAAGLAGGEIPVIDQPMLTDPPCENIVPRPVFPAALRDLWRAALNRTDTELRRAAADTVAVAQQRGMEGLAGLHSELVRILRSSEQNAGVRRAAARALVVLEARDQASLLAQIAKADGVEVARFVEPALARWGHTELDAEWLQRLGEPETPLLYRLLAAECIAIRQTGGAAGPLVAVVHDRRAPPALRLAASQALPRLSGTDLLGEARKLAADTSPTGMWERVYAVSLVAGQPTSDGVVEFLRERARDPQTVVAAAAYEQLLDRDPAKTFDLAAEALPHRDVKLRRCAARSLVAQADADAVQRIRPLLADVNTELRQWVAQSLVDLAARDDLRPSVLEAVRLTLAEESWQGLEQAALVAVALADHSAAPRLIELMAHGRPEVALTACFGLRKFRLPDTFPAMLEHAQKQHERQQQPDNPEYVHAMINEQHAQLFQSFGLERFAAAEPLMRRYVGKNMVFQARSRAAACWALGFLHEGKPDVQLAQQFAARLSDVNSQIPEEPEVRRMCAVSLGRMRATSTVPTLKTYAEYDSVYSDVGQAAWWAVEEMTDETRPAAPPLEKYILGWFLQPIEKP
ncbi:MAG: HEAT repeat domain-containing protein [Pirellulaceae bacterium]